MGILLRTISGVNNVSSEPYRSILDCSIAEWIKYDNTMKGHAFLWSIRQLNMEDLSNDCRTLKVLLQVSAAHDSNDSNSLHMTNQIHHRGPRARINKRTRLLVKCKNV